MKFSEVSSVRIPKRVRKIRHDGEVLWDMIVARYVSFGDSIAAGHAINDEWEKNYGYGSQYGKNGNTETAIVPGCYTDLIRNKLSEIYSGGRIVATSFAKSGDRVDDLIEKLNHDVVKKALAKADYVTLCIGANDVLEPALSHLDQYISAGDSALAEIAAIVEANLAVLADDSNANSYTALFNKLAAINPNAKYVFTTVYNPYKYLWIEDGSNGFFKPVLDTIPQMSFLGIDVTEAIKSGFLGTSVVRTLFSRVNGLSVWSEKYVTALNNVLRNKINAYGNANFILADTKAVYDPVPDRPTSAPKHYNDLVNVEYTRGYDTMQMDWGKLYEDSGGASNFWWGIATKYVSLSGLDIVGLASEVVALTIEKVIVPDVDPHPESYGHYAMAQSFADALGWSVLPRRTLSFNANGGSGSMASVTVVALDNMIAYTNLPSNAFTHPTTGYRFAGWNTSAGGGSAYSNGQFIGLSADTTLYAQWTNLYKITYKHTNHTNGVYGNDETGHMECYALWIAGSEMPDLGKFSDGLSPTYTHAYGTRVGVVVSNYNPSEIVYDDCDCDVYFNGANVAHGYRGTQFEFTLTSDVIIEFQWKIAGSLVTFDARSWEDCYITTY